MEDLVLDILDELRRSSELDAKALAALVRKHNDARSDVSTHLAKKHIHPFYLRVKSKDPARWARWAVDDELERRFLQTVQMKPRRTASGVATVTVITGLMIFCKFLAKNNLSFIENFISEQVAVFLNIHIDIRKLKFQSSEDMCPKKTFDFFMNQKGAKQENTSDKNIDDLDINEILMDINSKNTTNNSRENLNSMLLMASAFSGKGMKSNAKTIYAQIVNFIENTELKEYLSDIYKKAKSF